MNVYLVAMNVYLVAMNVDELVAMKSQTATCGKSYERNIFSLTSGVKIE